MPVSQRGVVAPRSGDVSPDEGEAKEFPVVEAVGTTLTGHTLGQTAAGSS
jgi:hypothetical protein